MKILRGRRLGLVGRMAAAAALVAGVGAAVVTPVAAVCDGPVPSFHDVVGTATTVVIGDVVAVLPDDLSSGRTDGRSGHFTLRVSHVLQGEAPQVMEIVDLRTQPCASLVLARAGDRIALAIGATDFTPPIRVNTAAWIRGEPYFGFERTTLAEVFSLMGLKPPATASGSSDRRSDAPGLPWPLAVLAGALGAAAMVRRLGGVRLARTIAIR